MTRPIIVYADAVLSTRNALRLLLPDHDVPAAQVSTRDLPGADEDRPLPYVQVLDDGPVRYARLSGVAPLRVRVWHTDVGAAKALAGLVQGIALAGMRGDGVRHYTAGTGPTAVEDPDTGVPLSTITLYARLIPRQL